MAIKSIFKCSGDDVYFIADELLERLNMSYEEANKNASNMAIISKEIKKENGRGYCELPLCHTLEAESLGSKVIYDHKLGNRISDYAINDISEIENISIMDIKNSRISEVLKAISILKEDGEEVILDVTGPISIATSIMDSQMFFKATKKDKEKIEKILAVIEDGTVDFILEAIKYGVDIISFADPTGAMDIVGPKVFNDLVGKSTYNILKRLEGKLGNAIIHLCGKTSTSLGASGLIETEKIIVEGQNYYEMLKNIKKERKDVDFVGHWCIKKQIKNNEVTSCKLV